VIAVEPGSSGKEEFVNTSIGAGMCRDAHRFADPARDRITLAAGDGDYGPVVTQLVADGFGATVLCCSHASRELREAATAFHPLDCHSADLALG
jgi:hypothetical protein